MGRYVSALALVAPVTPVALFALFAAVEAFVLKVMWGWYIVPTFSMPPLSFPAAYGIVLIISFLTYQHIVREDGEGLEVLTFTFLNLAICFGLGWIAHFFI